MTKFKVGDKVRIIGKSRYGKDFIGKVGVVERAKPDSDGDISVEINDYTACYLPRDVELLSQTPTKNRRITTLESEVADLKAKVEALEKAQKPMRVSEVADVYYRGEYVGKFPAQSITQNITVKSDADITKVASQLAKSIATMHVGETIVPRKKMSLTPNELRKAIIAEAKAFVEDVTAKMRSLRENREGNVTYRHKITIPEFHVNVEKRVVTVLVKGVHHGQLFEKAIAKCAPDDVFNADIGKAIALGRALDLDVSRFEQAVKPDKYRKGMTVRTLGGKPYKLTMNHEFDVSKRNEPILDDTEAVY